MLTDAYAHFTEGLELTVTLDKKARGVVADAPYAKGALTLVPLSSSVNVAAKLSNGSVEIMYSPPIKDVKLFVTPRCELHAPKADSSQFVVPFFCVPTSDSDAVNMVRSSVNVVVGTRLGSNVCETKLSIPVLVNSKAVKAGESLVCKLAPDPKAAAKSAQPKARRQA